MALDGRFHSSEAPISGTGRIRRSAPLVGLTARTAGEGLVAGLRGRREGGVDAEFYARTAERYTQLLGRSKGALMKVGQMLSMVPVGNMVPKEFQSTWHATLGRLRDDAPPMAPELAHEVLLRELGAEKLASFAEFDYRPIAAASIGQVHAALLRDGRAVAVKIQYPGVGEAILSDLRNTELLATFLSVIGGVTPLSLSVDIRGCAHELSDRIVEELDYRCEASNQARFAALYRDHPFIHVPEVIRELSTARVLTQELCIGGSWRQALEAEQGLRDSWADAIWRFVYGSHIRFGLNNADPHPGNYVFHDDGTVSFLDFGCVKRYTREQVDLMVEIVRRCMREDVQGTWQACVESGFWSSSDPVSAEEVFEWWHEPYRCVWAEQPFTITPEYAASWIERRFSPIGPSGNAWRHAKMHPDFFAWPRIELALSTLLGQLHATNDWQSMFEEYHLGAEPRTAMGQLDREHFERHPPLGF